MALKQVAAIVEASGVQSTSATIGDVEQGKEAGRLLKDGRALLSEALEEWIKVGPSPDSNPSTPAPS